MSLVFAARANAPFIEQVSAARASPPPPLACEFLSQNHGPIRRVDTEPDCADRGRHITSITFVGTNKLYKVYVRSEGEAERGFQVIVEYLLNFGYDTRYIDFFYLVYGGVSKSRGELKRAIEHERGRALYITAEETVAKGNELTVGELRTAISNFKQAATEAAAREETARANDETRLGRLQARYERRLAALVLPPDGFTTLAQAKAGWRLSKTLRDLQKVQAELELPVTETPERVTEAVRMADAYHLHHNETGEFVAPRPRGRPRRDAAQQAVRPRRHKQISDVCLDFFPDSLS